MSKDEREAEEDKEEDGCGGSVEVVLRRENVPCWSKWSVGDNLIATKLTLIWPPSLGGNTTGFKLWSLNRFFYSNHFAKISLIRSPSILLVEKFHTVDHYCDYWPKAYFLIEAARTVHRWSARFQTADTVCSPYPCPSSTGEGPVVPKCHEADKFLPVCDQGIPFSGQGILGKWKDPSDIAWGGIFSREGQGFCLAKSY